jgi:phosphate transport system substrate-binding protein
MKIKLVLLAGLSLLFIGCNFWTNSKEETIIEGKTTVLVDETLLPIVEAQTEIFESKYPAKLTILPKSEAEVITNLYQKNTRIAFLARKLTETEMKGFAQKKIFPKITPIAKDAIAFISQKTTQDTLVQLDEVLNMLKGIPSKNYDGLVFDNPNSSTARYLMELAHVNQLPEKGVYSFATNEAVVKYVAKNNRMLGVIGINYIFEPSNELRDFVQQIAVLSVGKSDGLPYYSPTQNNIAEGKYPLMRTLYVVNCQGYSGLGMGFASFVAGEIGQRIVLKSGLVPVKMPSRKIITRKTIDNEKNK